MPSPKKKTVSAEINEKIAIAVQPLIAKQIAEKDKKKQLKLQYQMIETTSSVTLEAIYRLTDSNFERFLKEQMKSFAEAYGNFQRDLIAEDRSWGTDLLRLSNDCGRTRNC